MEQVNDISIESKIHSLFGEGRWPVDDHGGIPQERLPVAPSSEKDRGEVGDGDQKLSTLPPADEQVGLGGRQIVSDPRKDISRAEAGCLRSVGSYADTAIMKAREEGSSASGGVT